MRDPLETIKNCRKEKGKMRIWNSLKVSVNVKEGTPPGFHEHSFCWKTSKQLKGETLENFRKKPHKAEITSTRNFWSRASLKKMNTNYEVSYLKMFPMILICPTSYFEIRISTTAFDVASFQSKALFI